VAAEAADEINGRLAGVLVRPYRGTVSDDHHWAGRERRGRPQVAVSFVLTVPTRSPFEQVST
jgi:hypothetical protein